MRIKVVAGYLAFALVLAELTANAAASCRLGEYATLPVTMAGAKPLIAGSINGVDALLVADSGALFSVLSRDSVGKFSIVRGASWR